MKKDVFAQGVLNSWRWGSVLLVCSIAIGMSGCADRDDDKVRTYGQDGYLGLTNSNPNMPGRHMAINYKSDGDMVDQVLKPVKGINSTQVIFNGTALHVNVKANKSLSDAEAEKLRQKVQSIVQYNMPRYRVHVEVKR